MLEGMREAMMVEVVVRVEEMAGFQGQSQALSPHELPQSNPMQMWQMLLGQVGHLQAYSKSKVYTVLW